MDAIAINQQDNIERGAQVANMGQIYTQADVVLCWWGNPSEHCTVAIRFLQELANSASR